MKSRISLYSPYESRIPRRKKANPASRQIYLGPSIVVEVFSGVRKPKPNFITPAIDKRNRQHSELIKTLKLLHIAEGFGSGFGLTSD